MEKFQTLTSRLAPLPNRNVDTDQIIPARYLKITDKTGLAAGLFANWRFLDPDTCQQPNPEFVLNQPQWATAKILLAGDNFGCGSSREHAPWAILGYGLRAVISTRFADIFSSNAVKNGLLLVTVTEEVSERLFRLAEENPTAEVTIDLEAQTVQFPGGSISFEIGSFARHCLLQGVDQLGYLLEQQDEVARFEQSHPAAYDTRSS